MASRSSALLHVGGVVTAGVSGGDPYVPKLRRRSSAAGCDPGPGFDRARAACHERALPRAPVAIRCAGVGGGAGSAGCWGWGAIVSRRGSGGPSRTLFDLCPEIDLTSLGMPGCSLYVDDLHILWPPSSGFGTASQSSSSTLARPRVARCSTRSRSRWTLAPTATDRLLRMASKA